MITVWTRNVAQSRPLTMPTCIVYRVPCAVYPFDSPCRSHVLRIVCIHEVDCKYFNFVVSRS